MTYIVDHIRILFVLMGLFPGSACSGTDRYQLFEQLYAKGSAENSAENNANNNPDNNAYIITDSLVPQKILILYLSRTKNTKAVAEIIHKKIGGKILALETATAYPEDYKAIVDQVSKENASGYLPKLKTVVDSIRNQRFMRLILEKTIVVHLFAECCSM